MRPYKDLDELMQQAEYFIDAVSGYRSDFALFPEFFNAPLMAKDNHLSEPEAIRNLAKHTAEIVQRFSKLAISYNINIITGSMPEIGEDTRKYGTTKFGMDRFVHGFLDLLTIWFISRFGKRPMHLFGALGVIMFAIGLAFTLYLGIDKLFLNPYGRLITQRPQFYIALATMIIGTQFFIAGFLGEIILRTKENKQRYLIKDVVNL